MIPLLRPLRWQGPLIPVLPSTLENMLEAPVPFVAGIQKLSNPDATGVIVDLEENSVQYAHVEEIPRLPESKKM